MRLWSLHPKYLDTKGLVALWRETLLAKSVLEGRTKGYKNHPQLERFKKHPNSLAAVNFYLFYVLKEAQNRGYRFDETKIVFTQIEEKIPITRGQLEYEFEHLLRKLQKRDPDRYEKLKNQRSIEPHPIFFVIEGDVESWEKVK